MTLYQLVPLSESPRINVISLHINSYAYLTDFSKLSSHGYTKVYHSSFHLIPYQSRSDCLPTEILFLTNNVGARRCYVLNQKALQCLRQRESAPVDAILYLDH